MPHNGCRMQRIPQSLLRGHKPHIICGKEGNREKWSNNSGEKKKTTLDLDFTGFVYVTGGKLKHALRLAGTVTRRADGRNGSL